MFTTFTDWEFDDISTVEATGSNMWPKMQAVGALSFKAVQTGENTARTMIQWPDAATAQAAVDDLRAAAMEMTDTRVVATAGGGNKIRFLIKKI